MRLRNYKETVAPTILDTLRDVHPHTLEDRFHWCAETGERVWVKVADEDGRNLKWRQGIVTGEGTCVLDTYSMLRSFYVLYHVKRKPIQGLFVPGMPPCNMKPDTPEVRALLREEGYFV